jgi:hypothetical protein
MSKKIAASSPQDDNQSKPHLISIPPLMQAEIHLVLVGDRPLLVNNKLAVAEELDATYGPGARRTVPKAPPTPEECYIRSFYVLPDSKYAAPSLKARYGVPCSGIKKCACSAIRSTGITDNTTVGLIQRSFWVLEDSGGLCLLQFKRLEHDVRAVNIGSGQKTVPRMAHRPIFFDWRINIRIKYNPLTLSPETLFNLFMYAGQCIGLCELRAEKKQGQCGGFIVEAGK